MRIMVLGGSGFIGRSTIRKLEQHEITIVHRGDSCSGEDRIRHIHCDSDDILGHRTAFREWRPDVVLDLLSRNGLSAWRTIHAIAGLSTRVTMASSISVYRSFGVMIGSEVGAIDNSPMNEDAPLRQLLFPYRKPGSRPNDDPKKWLDDYDKIPAEQAFLSQRDLAVNIVRLPMVYGPGDPDRRVESYVTRMLNGSEVLLQQMASAWRNSRAYVENVAEAIVRVLHAGAPGRIYNIADDGDFTEADWIRRIGEEAGWDGDIRIVPDGAAAGRPAIDELPAMTNFAQHLRMDTSRIRAELGFVEHIQITEALRSTILRMRRG